jgi:hypothetical protein
LLYAPHIERFQSTVKEKSLYLRRCSPGSEPVRRGQALSSSVVSRARRGERVEMKAISTKAVRCVTLTQALVRNHGNQWHRQVGGGLGCLSSVSRVGGRHDDLSGIQRNPK